MSDEGKEIVLKNRNYYLQILHNFIYNKYLNEFMNNSDKADIATLTRIGNMLFLLSTLTVLLIIYF